MLWYIYTVEYYSVVKRKEILSFMTAWMLLENITLSEISQLGEQADSSGGGNGCLWGRGEEIEQKRRGKRENSLTTVVTAVGWGGGRGYKGDIW